MAAPTHTVTRSWRSGTDAAPRFWVIANGLPGSLKADELIPEGAAIRVDVGRAVRVHAR